MTDTEQFQEIQINLNSPPKVAEKTGNVLEKWFEAFETVAVRLNAFPEAISRLSKFHPISIYAAAGYPLGKSMRGLKKWSKRNV